MPPMTDDDEPEPEVVYDYDENDEADQRFDCEREGE
jgi:hypothetical protein